MPESHHEPQLSPFPLNLFPTTRPQSAAPPLYIPIETSMSNSIRTGINRANARHSTGPRTEEGKRRSSMNAVSHGLTAKAVLLTNEDPAAFEQHAREFFDEYQPEGTTEKQQVKLIADLAWRLNRITVLESELLTMTLAENLTEQTRALAMLSMHQQRLGRQYERALDQLRNIQSERRNTHFEQMSKAISLFQLHQDKHLLYNSAEDGFVFSNQEIETHIRRRTRLQEACAAELYRSQRPADPDEDETD